MLKATNARANNDFCAYNYAQCKVNLFTKQLNESNLLLTKISNAMMREGMARERIVACRKGQGGGEEEMH
jgi:hypothetical protein